MENVGFKNQLRWLQLQPQLPGKRGAREGHETYTEGLRARDLRSILRDFSRTWGKVFQVGGQVAGAAWVTEEEGKGTSGGREVWAGARSGEGLVRMEEPSRGWGRWPASGPSQRG